ncbi:restriction endonuclease subunit S [Xenorhabdus sp. 42]|nr:restriction endonuclease subunit S [Xenorhabdus sp. CUL]MBD2821756.1 restriction endonuclease subunit S [Xenorhabdus sp. 42]MBD2823399.1 restriction endonuclease subunit S [Xenorhabdus sp. 5]
MNISKTLAEIANIKLGMAFTTAIKDRGNEGTCYLIQTKDISLDGNITSSSLAKVVPEGNPERHYLTPGDLLFRLRGPVFSAAIFNEEWDRPVITTNQTAVVRCNKKLVSPYYLQWYINSSLGQRYFSGMSEGTNINKVTAKILSAMPLNLPSLKQQHQIEKIHKNWLAQKETHQRLIANGDIYFDQLCTQIQLGNQS